MFVELHEIKWVSKQWNDYHIKKVEISIGYKSVILSVDKDVNYDSFRSLKLWDPIEVDLSLKQWQYDCTIIVQWLKKV